MKDYGLSVEFESDGFFTVTFERERIGGEKDLERLSENQKSILIVMKEKVPLL